MMGAPLDEKGHDASTQALLDAFPMADKIAAMYAEVAIRAYLSAAPALAVSQPIGDGMEVVAWRQECRDGDFIFFGGDPTSTHGAADPLVLLSDAQALIAAKDARIEELTRERDRVSGQLDASQTVSLMLGDKIKRANEELDAAHDARERAGCLMPLAECIDTLAEDHRAAEAQVAVLRAALERIKGVVTYPCDTSIQARGYGARSIDITGCEYIAELTDAALNSREKAE